MAGPQVPVWIPEDYTVLPSKTSSINVIEIEAPIRYLQARQPVRQKTLNIMLLTQNATLVGSKAKPEITAE